MDTVLVSRIENTMKAYSWGDVIDMAEAIEAFAEDKQRIADAAIDIRVWAEEAVEEDD